MHCWCNGALEAQYSLAIRATCRCVIGAPPTWTLHMLHQYESTITQGMHRAT